MGIKIDLGCGGTTDPYMVLGSGSGLVVSTVSSGSKGHPDQYVPSSIIDMDPNMNKGDVVGRI